MPDIEFKDLNRSIGTELFADTESFLEDLTDEATNIVGGISEGISIVATTVSDRTTTHYIPEPTGYFPPPHYYPMPPRNIATAFLPPTKPPHRRPPIHHTFSTNDV
jgi:hypothetical protein